MGSENAGICHPAHKNTVVAGEPVTVPMKPSDSTSILRARGRPSAFSDNIADPVSSPVSALLIV
jgi:hypothetical protein